MRLPRLNLVPVKRWWQRRDVATRTLPRYLRRAVSNFSQYGALRSAAVASSTLFSIFPLSLRRVVDIGSLLDVTVAQEQLASALRFFLPSTETVDLLLDNIDQTLDQNAQLSLVALVGLIWSGLGLFSNVANSLDTIFQVPTSRSIWRQRVIAILMTLVLITLVSTSFIASGALWLAAQIFFADSASLWITAVRLLLPFSLNIAIFVLLFRFVPARKVHWDAVWPAAIFGALGWELGKATFALYLEGFANYALVYGSIATVIVLLFWAFILAAIFIFSAELCAQLNEWVIAQHMHDDRTVTEDEPDL